jgi:streptogramin lyase
MVNPKSPHNKTMKTKTVFLLGILTAIAIVSAEAMPLYTTNTLSFSGASWSDGGSLDGYFTIKYVSGSPIAVLSLDVTTGNGTSDGFVGFNYIYNVSGQANTLNGTPTFDAIENDGAAANELVAVRSSDSDLYNYGLYLDWQGSNPTSLYLGNVGSQYSSEAYTDSPGIRSLNNEGGSLGPVPEPSTLALAGLGGLGLLLFRRRKYRGLAMLACFALAIGPVHAQNIFVANLGGDTVTEYSSSGTYLGVFASGLADPEGIALNSSGDLFVANYSGNDITEYGPSGTYLGVFASTGVSTPHALAIDSSGNLYVGNDGNNTVTEYSSSGTYLGAFASGLNTPKGLVFDSSGNLYVANASGNTISKFSSSGTAIGTFASTGLSGPEGIVIDSSGNLYAANSSGNTVTEYSSSGTDLGAFASGLEYPHGLAINSSGDLLVANYEGNDIIEYSSSGTDLGTFASTGLSSPAYIVITPNPVPEPSILALAGLGGLGLLRFRRRK